MPQNPPAELTKLPPVLVPAGGFTRASVLVVGDLMLDRYILGDVTRISPEAPVPVLAAKRRRSVPGGSANVALNVLGLRASVTVAGVVGDDEAGRELTAILSETGIGTDSLLVQSGRPTTCKTRVVCGNHQIVRFDDEVCDDLDPSASGRLLAQCKARLDEGIGVVILSDYAKGVLTVSLTESLIAECSRRGIPVFVDPKRSSYLPYAGATCITPNQREFRAASASMAIQGDDLLACGSLMRSLLSCESLLITQGADGMTLIAPDRADHLPALAEEVFDVSGAGDTVIATAAVAVAAGFDMLSAVRLANLAASLVVRHAGTAPVRWSELSSLLLSGHYGFSLGQECRGELVEA